MKAAKKMIIAMMATVTFAAAQASESSQGLRDQAAKAASGWTMAQQGLNPELPGDLNQEDFEATMKNNYYGSYVFYRSLSDIHKSEVYGVYRQTADIEAVRSKTMALMSTR